MEHEKTTEVLDSIEEPPLTSRRLWEREVRVRAQNKCSNCGSDDRLRVHMIVPLEAGGHFVESNGVLLCRTCDMAKDFSPGVKSGRWPVNIWVSRRLYDRIQETIQVKNGVKSMSSLARYLISKYITDEDSFDDLEQYQESGNDVKINVWVDKDKYETFQVLLKRRGMTVTDALKALITVWHGEGVHFKNGK